MKRSKLIYFIVALVLFVGLSFFSIIWNSNERIQKATPIQNPLLIAQNSLNSNQPMVNNPSTQVPIIVKLPKSSEIAQASHIIKSPTTSEMDVSMEQKSEFAYITLLHGLDDSFRYRGYLYNVLIMFNALRSHGSKADFIVLIGFKKDDKQHKERFSGDLKLLKSFGIQLMFLPRFLNDNSEVNFAEMALLKITPWKMTQYKRIQFFDGDIVPTANMDCFFELNVNTFNIGAASPLNSGWYLCIPNENDYSIMYDLAYTRLTNDWDEILGWGKAIPEGLTFRNGRQVPKWSFNGASLDQGLLTYHFILHNGRVQIIDVKTTRKYTKEQTNNNQKLLSTTNVYVEEFPMSVTLSCCKGREPTAFFNHFTGKNKPWLNDLKTTTNKQLISWARQLDSLKLDINSSNIEQLKSSPPLGFFYPNK